MTSMLADEGVLKPISRVGVGGALLCIATSLTAAFALAQSQPPGTEETPILNQTSYELKAQTPAGVVTEYVSSNGVRREYERGGSISISDFRTGENHFLNSLTHKDMIERGRPSVGKPRYYDSMRWLKKIGPCSYLGQDGSLWSRPAFGYADPETACITPDGIILAITDAGRPTKVPIEFIRRPIPDSMFDIPPGYTR